MSIAEREIKSLIGELMDEIDILPTAKHAPRASGDEPRVHTA